MATDKDRPEGEESDFVKIPKWFLNVALGGGIAWAAWMSLAVVELKADLRALTVEVNHKQTANR